MEGDYSRYCIYGQFKSHDTSSIKIETVLLLQAFATTDGKFEP